MASCCSIASVSEAREESLTYWHRSVEVGGVGCRKVSQGKPVLWGCPCCHLHKHSRVPGHWKSRRGEAAPHSACQPSWWARAVSPSQATAAWPKAADHPQLPACPCPPSCSASLRGFMLWDSLDLLFYSLAVQVRSVTALCQKAKLMFCSPVKFSRPEFPFPPRILSMTKPGLETLCLNTTVWIFFFGHGYMISFAWFLEREIHSSSEMVSHEQRFQYIQNWRTETICA